MRYKEDMDFIRNIICLGVLTTLLWHGGVSMAQPGTRFASGTGFFVSQNGHIITNEHVVHGCETVQIRGGVDPIEARVMKTDPENDLALLQANAVPQQIATLSTHPLGVQKGDKVMVIGYPMEHAITGDYVVKEAEIIDSTGPLNEPQWLQFSDSAQQGNSGGPLLDTSGHVVGVITGKAEVFSVNPETQAKEKVRQSDVAVSLPVLIHFLEMNAVYFNRSPYITYYMPDRIEDMAKYFIVNIHCPQAGEPQ